MSDTTKKFLTEIKYKLLKAIDIAGLGFLSPVVRLSYGEEPAVQLKQIFQMIVIPLVAIGLFIAAWFTVADKVQTKSGKLPNPTETVAAYASIMTMHDREKAKAQAYEFDGEKRTSSHDNATRRLEEIAPKAETAAREVADAKATFHTALAKQLAPLEAEYQTEKTRLKRVKSARITELKAQADQLVPDDRASHDAFLSNVSDHEIRTASEKATLRKLKSHISEIRGQKSPRVAAAVKNQTEIVEEQQYLAKVVDQLTTANRANKVAKAEEEISTKLNEFYTMSGADAYLSARKITTASKRIDKIKESEYAQPWTLPMQIARSVFCVFTGFLLGSLIAIPFGILCGLSLTFMAAMTPFIATLKPVSPIVWLPIALILVGGFIPDPDKNSVLQGLWNAPLIGWMKINPAFIASAVTVALCSLWPTLVNTALGVASMDKDHINVARVLKLGFWSRLFKIVIPSALPLIFAGLRISLGVGWMVLIAAELLASSEGLGKFVWDQFNNGASDSFAKMVVVVFVVGIIGLLLDRIMIVFQRLVSFDGSPSAI